MKVLITRALSQAKNLEYLSNLKGYTPLLFPSLKIIPLQNFPLKKHYDAVIFISVNAVDYGVEIFNQLDTKNCTIFAIGNTSAKRLEKHNIKVDCYPQDKASSESLLATEHLKSFSNKSILIFRGYGGRKTLKAGLLKNNNEVEYVNVYQRITAKLENLHKKSLIEFLNNKGVITITSVENLASMIELIKQIDINYLPKIKNYPLIVLSDRIKAYAQSVGFKKILVTTKMNDNSIVEAVSKAI